MRPITAYKTRPRQFFIAMEGFPFIVIALAAAFLMWMVGFVVGAVLMILVAGFVIYFFRNPDRVPPAENSLVVAPADGRILSITKNVIAPCACAASTKISIFMSVLNVHINRFPVAARVVDSSYIPGKFLVASLDKASEHNERNLLVLEDESARQIVMVQIAGLIARRIVCYVKTGDFLKRGERFGLIRFGSRVDLYLPISTEIRVRVGEKVRSGETIVGRFV